MNTLTTNGVSVLSQVKVSVTSFTFYLIKKFKYFCSIDKPLEMITFIFLDNVPEDPYPFALVDDKVSF